MLEAFVPLGTHFQTLTVGEEREGGGKGERNRGRYCRSAEKRSIAPVHAPSAFDLGGERRKKKKEREGSVLSRTRRMPYRIWFDADSYFLILESDRRGRNRRGGKKEKKKRGKAGSSSLCQARGPQLFRIIRVALMG